MAELALDPRASMAQIAQRAGVSRVTLYGHVATRADLLTQVLAQHVSDAVAALAECSYDQGGAAMVNELVRCSWDLMASLGPLLAEAEAELGAASVRHAHGGVLARVDELISQGMAEGHLASTQPSQWLSYAYFSLLSGAAHLAATPQGRAEVVEELIESVTVLFQAQT